MNEGYMQRRLESKMACFAEVKTFVPSLESVITHIWHCIYKQQSHWCSHNWWSNSTNKLIVRVYRFTQNDLYYIWCRASRVHIMPFPPYVRKCPRVCYKYRLHTKTSIGLVRADHALPPRALSIGSASK